MAIKKFSTTGQIVSKETNGWHHEYYADGSLKEIGKYFNDEMDGEWKFYKKGGQLNLIKTFKNGIINGKYEKYGANGLIVEEGNYIDGKISKK